jgi:uncharacterized protein with NRDE domain
MLFLCRKPVESALDPAPESAHEPAHEFEPPLLEAAPRCEPLVVAEELLVCLIVFDWRPDASQGALLTLAANRDEFYARPAAPLGWWSDAPDLLAGRDLQGGGTWMGITRSGRFAALTNFRAPAATNPTAPSRGGLVSGFLRDQVSPADYLAGIVPRAHLYSGFNLLVGDLAKRDLRWFSNCADIPAGGMPALAAGSYGLSNALLDTPWPKVVAKKAGLLACMEAFGDAPAAQRDALLDLMRDPTTAPDETLPSTGLTLERERALSAAYIRLPNYGTRCTTVLQVGSGGCVNVKELGDSTADGRHEDTALQSNEYQFQIQLGSASTAKP